MPSDKLTELGLRKAKPSSKPKKLSDGGGLFLLLHPSGSKYWRMKYRFMGKEKLLAIGVWPEVSLTEARNKRNEAKLILKSGKDPSVDKKNENSLGTFCKAIPLSQYMRNGLRKSAKNGGPLTSMMSNVPLKFISCQTLVQDQ